MISAAAKTTALIRATIYKSEITSCTNKYSKMHAQKRYPEINTILYFTR